jgi:integrase/recombinase XerD
MEQSITVSLLPFGIEILAGTLAPSSRRMYARDIGAYLAFAQTQEDALDPATLARWRTELAGSGKYSPNTINRMISAVRSLMFAAAEQRFLSREDAEAFSQVRGVKVASMKDRRKAHARTLIDPKDMQRLTKSPDASTLLGLRDRALLHVLASSGVRVSEAATLTVDRVRQDGKEYYVEVCGKNDIEFRKALLSPTAYRAIKAWLKARNTDCPYIFTSFTNHTQKSREKPMSTVAVWNTVQGYADACGLSHIKPHDFRRFVGTQVTSTHGIRQAQKALGHKRLETTAQYDLGDLKLGMTNHLY